MPLRDFRVAIRVQIYPFTSVVHVINCVQNLFFELNTIVSPTSDTYTLYMRDGTRGRARAGGTVANCVIKLRALLQQYMSGALLCG